MPSWAHVVAEITCAACGVAVPRTESLTAFQWGYCPSRLPYDELFYRVGDAILWRLDDAGSIPPWVYFEGGLQGGNLGDPAHPDVVVRAYDLAGVAVACGACGAGVALEIRAGRIVGFIEAVARVDVAVVRGDGSVEPRFEWNDRAMSVLRVRSVALATGDGAVVRGNVAP